MPPPSGWTKVPGTTDWYTDPNGNPSQHPEWADGAKPQSAANYSDTFAGLPGVTHVNDPAGGPGSWVIQGADGQPRALTEADIEALQNPVRRSVSSSSSSSVSSVSPETLAAQAAMAEASDARAAQLKMEELRARLAELGVSQSFNAGESATERAFRAAQTQEQLAASSAEGAAGRQFNAEQSAIQRAQRNSEFAATFGLQAQAERRQQLNDLFQRQTALENLRMENAKALANVISLVDPAALPAFYEAGGGNIGNAIASGANAVSDNAVLPAAQNLDVAKRSAITLGNVTGEYNALKGAPLPGYTPAPEPAMGSYGPVYTPRPAAAAPAAAGGNPAYAAAVTGAAGGLYGIPTNNPSGTQLGNTGFMPGIDANGNLVATPMAADGGMFNTNRVVVGDSKNGRPNPELVMSNGPISVIPVSDLPHMADGGVAFSPAAGLDRAGYDARLAGVKASYPGFNFMDYNTAHGLDANGNKIPEKQYGYKPPAQVQQPTYIPAITGLEQSPADTPVGDISGNTDPNILAAQQQAQATPESIEKVRQIRAAVDTSLPLGTGPYNPLFGLLPPSLIARYYAAIQSRFGVPAADQQAEQQRYQLAATRRGPQFNQYLNFAV